MVIQKELGSGAWQDGIIKLGSPIAKELGFTVDLFDGWLWKKGDAIVISFIESKVEGKGNLSGLWQRIWDKGYKVQVPTPLGKMRLIVEAKGFRGQAVCSEGYQDYVELWEKGPD